MIISMLKIRAHNVGQEIVNNFLDFKGTAGLLG